MSGYDVMLGHLELNRGFAWFEAVVNVLGRNFEIQDIDSFAGRSPRG
jgi:hypothetical protein